MDEIDRAAKKALEECLKLKENEECLIITDEHCEEIGESFYRTSEEITKESYLLKVPEQKLGELKPPELAEKVIKMAPDVIIIPTRNSYTHMKIREEACEKKSRVVTLPGINKEMFKRAVDIHYGELREEGEKLMEKMKKAEEARIKTNSGTDLKLKIPNEVMPDLGNFHEPGSYGNLPTGEVFTAPDEKEVNGKIVIDSMQDIAKPKTKVYIQNGEAQAVEGDENFKKKLWSYENGRNIAELGIGLNPKATLTGNILEDEKVKGTCHVAFGRNEDFGGSVDAEIHWDAILLQPDIWLDEEKVMESGELEIQ